MCQVKGPIVSSPSTRTESARQIVNGFLAKNPSAFEALYCELKNLKYLFQRHLGPNDAQDLFHDLIMELAASIRDGHLRYPEALYGYANVIARRKVIEARAKRQRITDLPDRGWSLLGDGHVNTERDYRAAEEREIALRILKAMPGRDRNVLVRFYFEEQTPEHICRDLDLTGTQFRLIKSRAKRRFTELCAVRFAQRKPPTQAEAPMNRVGHALEA